VRISPTSDGLIARVSLSGMRGLYVATNMNGADLDEKRFWDVYAKAEELGWTVFLHSLDTIGRDGPRAANQS